MAGRNAIMVKVGKEVVAVAVGHSFPGPYRMTDAIPRATEGRHKDEATFPLVASKAGRMLSWQGGRGRKAVVDAAYAIRFDGDGPLGYLIKHFSEGPWAANNRVRSITPKPLDGERPSSVWKLDPVLFWYSADNLEGRGGPEKTTWCISGGATP